MDSAILRTPIIYSPGLSKMTGAALHLKLENQQVTSSFNVRGAFTRMTALDKTREKQGVIAMSAGNHAQAVAYHAQKKNIPSVIVMPAQTPFSKVNRTRAWGAEVILEGRNLNESEATVDKIILGDFQNQIYRNISLNSGIRWGLADPRPPHGFPRVLGHGGTSKQFFEIMIFDDLPIGL